MLELKYVDGRRNDKIEGTYRVPWHVPKTLGFFPGKRSMGYAEFEFVGANKLVLRPKKEFTLFGLTEPGSPQQGVEFTSVE